MIRTRQVNADKKHKYAVLFGPQQKPGKMQNILPDKALIVLVKDCKGFPSKRFDDVNIGLKYNTFF